MGGRSGARPGSAQLGRRGDPSPHLCARNCAEQDGIQYNRATTARRCQQRRVSGERGTGTVGPRAAHNREKEAKNATWTTSQPQQHAGKNIKSRKKVEGWGGRRVRRRAAEDRVVPGRREPMSESGSGCSGSLAGSDSVCGSAPHGSSPGNLSPSPAATAAPGAQGRPARGGDGRRARQQRAETGEARQLARDLEGKRT